MRNGPIPKWMNVGDKVFNGLSPKMPQSYVDDVIEPSNLLASGPFVVEYYLKDGKVNRLMADRLHVTSFDPVNKTLGWIDIDRGFQYRVVGVVRPHGNDGLEFDTDRPLVSKVVIRPLRSADSEWIIFMKDVGSVREILNLYAHPEKWTA